MFTRKLIGGTGGTYVLMDEKGNRKNKNRHLSREQRMNGTVRGNGVRVFSGDLNGAIPFQEVKKINNSTVQDAYVAKASDVSVVPNNQYFNAIETTASNGSKTVVVEKDKTDITPPTPVKKDSLAYGGTDEIKKFFQIKEIVEGK